MIGKTIFAAIGGVTAAFTSALWQLYFGPTTLGWFDEELFVIFDTHGNTGRNPIC